MAALIGDLPLFLLVCALSVIGFVEPSPVYMRTVNAYRQLAAILDKAKTNNTMWGGTTIYIHTIGDSTQLSVYRGEPGAGSTNPGAEPIDLSAPLSVGGVSNGAIFIDPDGSIRVQNGWTPWTTVATPPTACSTSLNVQSTYAGYPTFGTLDCTSTD